MINPTGSATGAEGSVIRLRGNAMRNGSAKSPRRSNAGLKRSVPASDKHHRRVHRILLRLLIATSRVSTLALHLSLFLTAPKGYRHRVAADPVQALSGIRTMSTSIRLMLFPSLEQREFSLDRHGIYFQDICHNTEKTYSTLFYQYISLTIPSIEPLSCLHAFGIFHMFICSFAEQIAFRLPLYYVVRKRLMYHCLYQ